MNLYLKKVCILLRHCMCESLPGESVDGFDLQLCFFDLLAELDRV